MLADQQNTETSQFFTPCGLKLEVSDDTTFGLTNYLDALLGKCLVCGAFNCMKLEANIENSGQGEVGALDVECFGTPTEV